MKKLVKIFTALILVAASFSCKKEVKIGDDPTPPSIDLPGTNVFTHGETYTITGANFGEKSQGPPIYWDSVENLFSSLSDEETIPTGEIWYENQNNLFKYNTTASEQYGTSTANYKGAWDGTNDNAPFFRKPIFAEGTFSRDHYITWNFKSTTQLNRPEASAWTLKLYRWWHHNAGDTNRKDLVRNTSGGESKSGVYIHPHDFDDNCVQSQESADAPVDADVWYRFEEFFRFGTGQSPNGRWDYWHHNGNSITHSGNESWQSGFGCYYDNAPLNYLHLLGINPGGAYDWTPQSGIIYMDNIYIDNTPARIEIGDSENFDDCKRREIQIPIEWSDTSITFETNKGNFLAEETLFLFIINNAGNPSDGLPITFN